MAKLPKKRLVKLPKRKPGDWQKTVVFSPKKAPDIVTEFALRPSAVSLSKKPCTRVNKSGEKKKTLRACHVELVLNEGVFLRFCTKVGEAGPLVPVASHREATEISTKYCACIAGGETRKACTIKAVPPGSPLGDSRRRKP